MGIPSGFLVFIYLSFLFGKEQELHKELVYLVAGILKKGEIVAEDMVFGVFLFKLDIVIPLKKADTERFPEFLKFIVVRDERKPFCRKTVHEEFEIQIIGEVDVIFHLYLKLLRFRLGYFFKYLYEGVVFIDGDSFFIHIGRLCSGVYELWGLFSGGAFLPWLWQGKIPVSYFRYFPGEYFR